MEDEVWWFAHLLAYYQLLNFLFWHKMSLCTTQTWIHPAASPSHSVWFRQFCPHSLKPNQLFYYFIKLFWYVQEWAWLRVKILKCKINSTFITLRAKLQKSDIVLLFSQGSYSSSIMFEPIYTFFRNQSSWQPTQCTWDTVGR